MDPIVIGLAAFVGGIIAAVLGWLDSTEPFNPRKFAYSIVHALVAGVAFAIAYSYSETITILDIFAAVIAGAGADSILNRAEGSIVARLNKK